MNGIEKGKNKREKSVKLKADPVKRLTKLVAFKLD